MKNHFDKNGNYINIENLSLAEIYHRGYQDGSEDGLNGIRPHGKWIEKVETKQLGHGWLTTHEIVCSVCGGSGENDENIPQCWKFCPNCGADMRGEDK